MTNPRDLQNHMAGDPVDNRAEFGTDYKGDMTYTYQKVWMYHGELFTDEDKDKWLYLMVVEHNKVADTVAELIENVSAADVFEWLTSDSFIGTDTLLENIGATVANEGDAA
ncbi:hypothetical protein [Furfurilactobacillus milii]|uniref:hypothetical protein n=1 Tax=Furfurilactobacillus milii TaxID=2888272 RepID=UPI001F1F4BB0|nr:hypothetical protein [Furfurilactobacillus milii]MCF6419792.1 hypothetical protein [Furfurilactobacillus milii]